MLIATLFRTPYSNFRFLAEITDDGREGSLLSLIEAVYFCMLQCWGRSWEVGGVGRGIWEGRGIGRDWDGYV